MKATLNGGVTFASSKVCRQYTSDAASHFLGLSSNEGSDFFELSARSLQEIALLAASTTIDPFGASAVSLSCFPWIPLFPSLSEDRPQQGDTASARARSLQHSLGWISAAVASAATVDLALNDPLSGLIGCGIATLGFQAATSNGSRFLPIYVVLSFCNGTMQVLLSAELWAARQGALGVLGAAASKAASHGIFAKIAAGSWIISPALMFTGMFVAWRLHDELAAQRRAVTQRVRMSGLPATSDDDRPLLEQAVLTFRPFAGSHFRLDPTEDDAKKPDP